MATSKRKQREEEKKNQIKDLERVSTEPETAFGAL
jgi:hypothetical protein